MADQAPEIALRRIEDALARIETAAARLRTGTPGLERRHERLRERVQAAIAALDEIIAREDEG
ncbi:hypothetical protein [Sphingomonas sp. DT-204]|uniref:hypothetical protein n=1 Tax=Sphingomonas sp. DT-204 TaxID=3396166 RepID=UPI003F1D9573